MHETKIKYLPVTIITTERAGLDIDLHQIYFRIVNNNSMYNIMTPNNIS